MSNKTILLIYGRGGHNEQMRRLHLLLLNKHVDYKFIVIAEQAASILNDNYPTFFIAPVRDKYSKLKTLVGFPKYLFITTIILVKILFRYRPYALISTGPGLTIIPAIIFKLLNKKVIFIETWSRFYSKSLTGKIMYYLSNTFYVQNKELKKLFPKSVYSGRL